VVNTSEPGSVAFAVCFPAACSRLLHACSMA
jgi:hypothetical protein